MSSSNEDSGEDMDKEKDEIEFQCFLLILDLLFIMSSFTCLANSIASSRVHFGILAMRIFSLFRKPDQNVSFKNESYVQGEARMLLSLVNHL
jgi:hypothetical protein